MTTSFPAYEGHIQSPFIYQLAKHLAKHAEVHVVCPYYKLSKRKQELWGSLQVHRFQYFYPRRLQKLTSGGGIPSNLKESHLAKLQFPLFFFSFLLKSRKVAKQSDVIHCQWSFSALAGVILKKLYKKPLIMTERGASANLASKNWIMRKALLWVLKNCDVVTANNHQQVEMLAELYKKHTDKELRTETTPNGIDTEQFAPRDQKEARQKLGLGDEKVVLFVGWFIQRKGLNYLIDAMKKVSAKHKDVKLYAIGEGILEEKHRKQIQELGLEGVVEIVGSKKPEEIPLWMNASDMLVLPSLSEGRPNVVPEAMSSGIPCVATKVSGTPEFIDHNVDGFLVEPKNSEVIAEKIEYLLEHPEELSQMKKAARESVLKKLLTWDRSAEKFIALYKSISR